MATVRFNTVIALLERMVSFDSVYEIHTTRACLLLPS
jgi:hypothetical protein